MKLVFNAVSFAIAILLLFSAADRWFNSDSYIVGMASSYLVPTQYSFHIVYSIILLKISTAFLLIFRSDYLLPYLLTIAISAIYTLVAFSSASSNCGCSRLFEDSNKTENLMIIIIMTVLSIVMSILVLRKRGNYVDPVGQS